MSKEEKTMNVLPVEKTTRVSTPLPQETYNALADYANEQSIFNMAVVVRQACSFFIDQKLSSVKLEK